ncbi:MAG: MarR family transcriptional regulator [Saprospirales bacterium]|nr:MAG: MarR family transcriptional regulator [Saprospirales bacterium]
MQIEDEIKQKQFINEYIKLDVNIMFTASYLGNFKSDILKPYNISWQQFNILRILKGQEPKPASIKSLTDRMVDRTSNASRLVDKLYRKELVDRCINDKDRRRADVVITKKGKLLLQECSKELEQKLTEKISALSLDEVRMANSLLNKMRN